MTTRESWSSRLMIKRGERKMKRRNGRWRTKGKRIGLGRSSKT
jgi:hypothetical protein